MDKFTQEVNEAILKHKWIESEKVGKDIGIINARRDWLINHWGRFKNYFDRKEAGLITDE
ncbi:MAG: hypothetical protein PHX90_07335 [Thermotogota bacterium]|nr:hypothetical protein [Thermotogota bacterium]